jgi:uncharacterized cupin superfamily protein
MPDQAPIANFNELSFKTHGNGANLEYRHARLGPQLGLKNLGCAVYVVPPGKKAFPYHAHSLIEELFIVLEGSGTLRHDGKEFSIRAGDVISSEVGKPHQIINTSGADLKYLAVSGNAVADVVLYPDSKKVQAVSGAFGKTLWHITKLSDARDYYEGEE